MSMSGGCCDCLFLSANGVSPCLTATDIFRAAPYSVILFSMSNKEMDIGKDAFRSVKVINVRTDGWNKA